MTSMLRRSAKIVFKVVCLCLLSHAANHQGRSAANFLQSGMAVIAANQDTVLSPTVVVVLNIIIFFLGMAEVTVDLFCPENHNAHANQHGGFLPLGNLMIGSTTGKA
jgi:hypothetical protein